MDFPRYIAHRGLHDGTAAAPENSLAAFERAAEKGFAVELDVRFTADRRMVVFHDAVTSRMCGVKREVANTEYSQLRELRLLGGECRIPLLTEVLKLIAGRVMILVELKNTAGVPDAEKRLAHLLMQYDGEFAVQSFDPFALKRLRAAAPDIVRGQLVSTYGKQKRMLREIASMKPVWQLISKPQFISWDLRSVTLEAAFWAADIDAHFITWTADSIELIKAAESFSGSIIFENIEESYFDGRSQKN